jgi:hypothetical protein
VDPNSTRSGTFIKVNRDRIRNLLLQIAEVFALATERCAIDRSRHIYSARGADIKAQTQAQRVSPSG